MASLPKRISAAISFIAEDRRKAGLDFNRDQVEIRCGELALRTLLQQCENDGSVDLVGPDRWTLHGIAVLAESSLPIQERKLLQHQTSIFVDGVPVVEIPLLGTVS